jgi:AraC-like DNA-binding protein
MINPFKNQDFIVPEYIRVGIVHYPPGGTLGPRIQSTIELVMIHQGEMRVLIDKEPHEIGCDTISIFFPGHQEYYIFSKETNTIHSYLHIAFPELLPAFNERLHQIPRTIPLSKQMAQMTRDILVLRSSELSTRDVILKSQALFMFWQFVGEAEALCSSDDTKPAHDIVENARRFIKAHLSEDITLEQIADSVSVCPEYLIRVFKQEFDTTPIAYLWQKRVGLGIELLETSGLSISMVAERCGFKTRNHFSRRIQEATGNSPKDVRKNGLQNVKGKSNSSFIHPMP